MKVLTHWFLATLAIIIAAYLLPGVRVSGFLAALVAAVVLGLINAVLRPIFILLTLPINILTLGLFTLVINALLIMLTSAIVPGFEVRGFGWAILFGVVLFFVNWILRSIGGKAQEL